MKRSPALGRRFVSNFQTGLCQFDWSEKGPSRKLPNRPHKMWLDFIDQLLLFSGLLGRFGSVGIRRKSLEVPPTIFFFRQKGKGTDDVTRLFSPTGGDVKRILKKTPRNAKDGPRRQWMASRETNGDGEPNIEPLENKEIMYILKDKRKNMCEVTTTTHSEKNATVLRPEEGPAVCRFRFRRFGSCWTVVDDEKRKRNSNIWWGHQVLRVVSCRRCSSVDSIRTQRWNGRRWWLLPYGPSSAVDGAGHPDIVDFCFSRLWRVLRASSVHLDLRWFPPFPFGGRFFFYSSATAKRKKNKQTKKKMTRCEKEAIARPVELSKKTLSVSAEFRPPSCLGWRIPRGWQMPRNLQRNIRWL